ncbi:hypothetical protein FXN61_31005 [Lentzea sp. PSKA42]|uniref:DUF6985 domain-containing protein n=1 Tax=Lentzea indica TaxID=2604800 RepID=A0ABX1FPY2_9PSEU|nr:hypothetical protein [Lentzea indica]NKE60975.1 hypothetical protein [Lentzea indica]
MEIPGLGPVVEDEYGSLVSAPVPVPVFGNASLPFTVDGYADDPAKEDFHAAIRTFLALDSAVLEQAGPAVFEYYRDIAEDGGEDQEDFPRIAAAGEVWDHVLFDRHEVSVQRDGEGEPVYVSVECECAWEPEHGLQLVFRDGARVTKVGPYDGHLTNASAYARDVIYAR